jgi:putative hydrolase of the HAD superfamily
MPRARGLTLFIDADDTLWENNIFFDAIVSRFVAMVGRHGCPPEHARARLLDLERARTKEFGYGVLNFQASLELACAQLLEGRDWQDERGALRELCTGLRRRAVLHLADVEATLTVLASRHRVVLFTKGDLDDQLGKVARSGLRGRLHQVDVVVEKDADTYRDALRRHGTTPERSWMIGNSPKSDILPAIEAGLGAVFIPHAATWTLELVDLPPSFPGRYLQLERFSQLLDVF